MKCQNCGIEFNDEFNCCPNCGTPAASPVAFGFNPFIGRILEALKDKMFLAICILITASAALSIIGGSLPLLYILASIFLWLTYSQANKEIVDQKHLRSLSGTIYAGYVIANVGAILLIVCGVIISLLFGVLANSVEFIATFEAEIGMMYPEYSALVHGLLGVAGWLIGVIFTVVSVIGLVINILGMRKVHRFVRSVYQSITYPVSELANPRGAKNWLIFFGVCQGIMALSSLETIAVAISLGCAAAAMIIAAILINKYFLPVENR